MIERVGRQIIAPTNPKGRGLHPGAPPPAAWDPGSMRFLPLVRISSQERVDQRDLDTQ
jgi:hypothetical protein